MNISSGQKKLALGIVVLAVIGGAAAYIFLDPFADKASSVVVAPKPQPRPAKPAVKTPVPLLATAKPAAVAGQAIPATALPAAPEPAATVSPAAAPVPSVATMEKPVSARSDESPPPLKLSGAIQHARTKPVSSPSEDLRHCLDQPTNQEIARCAGE